MVIVSDLGFVIGKFGKSSRCIQKTIDIGTSKFQVSQSRYFKVPYRDCELMHQAGMLISTVTAILQNSPWWVFVVFATLTVQGIQALRTRTLPIWRALIAFLDVAVSGASAGYFLAWMTALPLSTDDQSAPISWPRRTR